MPAGVARKFEAAKRGAAAAMQRLPSRCPAKANPISSSIANMVPGTRSACPPRHRCCASAGYNPSPQKKQKTEASASQHSTTGAGNGHGVLRLGISSGRGEEHQALPSPACHPEAHPELQVQEILTPDPSPGFLADPSKPHLVCENPEPRLFESSNC